MPYRNTDAMKVLWDHSPIVLAYIDLDGSWLNINPAGEEFFGYALSELREIDWQRLTHHEDLKADEHRVADLIAGKMPHYTMFKRYYTKSGAVRDGLLRVAIVRDKEGKPMHFVSQIVPQERHENLNIRNNGHGEIEVSTPSVTKAFLSKHWQWLVVAFLTTTSATVGFIVNDRLQSEKLKLIEQQNQRLEKRLDQLEKPKPTPK